MDFEHIFDVHPAESQSEMPMKNSNLILKLKDHEADPLDPKPLDLSKAVRGKYFDHVRSVRTSACSPDVVHTLATLQTQKP